MWTKIVSEKQMSTGFEDAAIFPNPTDCPWVSEDEKIDNFSFSWLFSCKVFLLGAVLLLTT